MTANGPSIDIELGTTYKQVRVWQNDGSEIIAMDKAALHSGNVILIFGTASITYFGSRQIACTFQLSYKASCVRTASPTTPLARLFCIKSTAQRYCAHDQSVGLH